MRTYITPVNANIEKVIVGIIGLFNKHHIDIPHSIGILTEMTAEGIAKNFPEEDDEECAERTNITLKNCLKRKRLKQKLREPVKLHLVTSEGE